MKALRELTSEMLDLISEIEENEGEMTEEIANRYEATKENIEQKVENYASYIAELKGDANVLDDEIKRLQARKKAINGRIESLKDNLLLNMSVLDMDKIKTPLYTASIRSTKSLNVDEEVIADMYADTLIEQFKEQHPFVAVELKPQKADVTAFVKDGGDLPVWASFVTNNSLNIR